MAARVAVGLLAVLVIGWLVVLERDVRLEERAADRSRPGATQAQLAAAAGDLGDARLLNPDREPDIALAVVENGLGRERGAVARLEAVLRAEPGNLLAWELLAVYARNDPAAVRRARDARARLDPLGAGD
jgi:hypothetical protein